MNRGVFATVSLSLCWAVALPLHAQPSPEAALPAEYELLVREGVDEFGRGNFVEARALFEQAHQKQPSARTLRGLGLCAYELKHYQQAISELNAALVDARNPLSDAQRAEVSVAIDKARRYVGTLHVETEPAEVTLALDGQPTAGRDLDLDAGDYRLSASAPGYKDGEQRVTVSGGQRQTVRIMLSRVELGSEGPAPKHAAAAEAEAVGPGLWPWVVTGASGAFMIGGGVLLALAMNDIGTVEDAKKGVPFSELQSAYDGAPVKSAVGFVLLGVGAAGVGVGLFWALGSSDEQAPVRIGLGPRRIALTGSF